MALKCNEIIGTTNFTCILCKFSEINKKQGNKIRNKAICMRVDGNEEGCLSHKFACYAVCIHRMVMRTDDPFIPDTLSYHLISCMYVQGIKLQ